MKRICIVFVVLLLFPYFNMFVWTPSEPDAMSSQASALSTESSSASASPYYLAAIGADDTAAVLDGYPVKETVIAVIDTGAELSHEDLVDSLWINEAERNGTDNVDDDGNGYIDDIYGVDFINNVPTPAPDNPSAPLRYEAPEDDSNTSHGTHVSGIIGMNPDNAVGYAGVGYRTKIMILKAGNYKNSFSFANAAKALQYAVANGADVINIQFYKFNAFNANMSSGKKQGEILCFDLAYLLFADEEGLPCLHFLLNDKKELMHDNQLIKVAEFIQNKNIQLVISILKDKLPKAVLDKAHIAVELSQQEKLFRIENG